jgi:hypothetical protein
MGKGAVKLWRYSVSGG